MRRIVFTLFLISLANLGFSQGSFSVDKLEDPANNTTVGTLRWAIAQVNASATGGTITFNLPSPYTIVVNSQLPIIYKRIIIDGETQLGYPLNQVAIQPGISILYGLTLYNTDSSVIKGLYIKNFSSQIIRLINSTNATIENNIINCFPSNSGSTGIIVDGSSNCKIFNNYIGTDKTGLDAGLWYGIACASSNSLIVGGPGKANKIVYCGIGVSIIEGSKNLLSQNVIFNADSKAIELAKDGPLGNKAKESPEILEYSYTGLVTGTCDPYDIIELFWSTGDEYSSTLTSKNANEYKLTVTNADGDGKWSAQIPTSTTYLYVTATATDAENNTSELSKARLRTSCPSPDFSTTLQCGLNNTSPSTYLTNLSTSTSSETIFEIDLENDGIYDEIITGWGYEETISFYYPPGSYTAKLKITNPFGSTNCVKEVFRTFTVPPHITSLTNATIINLLEPLNYAKIPNLACTDLLKYQFTSIPTLGTGVSAYKIYIQTAPEVVKTDGMLTADWQSKREYSYTSAILTSNTVFTYPACSLLTQTNKAGNYYWRVGLQYQAASGGIQPILWSSEFKLKLEELPVNVPAAYLDNNHTNSINWMYEVSYMEDGKNNQNIAYIDGLGNARQNQTLLSSEAKVMCVETAYSEEGGGAVKTMVAPTGATQFAYDHDFFDVKQSDNTYRDFGTVDFDMENFTTKTPVEPTPVDNAIAGSVGNYYSNNNTLNSYVDNAKGYPYAYAAGYKDPLNRTMLSSGVGETFRMSGGKEVKTFYAKPSRKELIRIYGVDYVNNALDITNITETIVTDPNGVSSVTYTDIEGKVIATALTTCNATNQDNLNEDGMAGFKNVQTPLDNNVTIPAEYTKVATSSFFIPCTTTGVSIDYSVDLAVDLAGVYGGITCASCKYDLVIEIKNNTTGQQVYRFPATGTHVLAPTANGCTGSSTPVDGTATANIITLDGPATYTVTRTLSAYKNSSGVNIVDEIINNFISDANNPNNYNTYHGMYENETMEEKLFVLRQYLDKSNITIPAEDKFRTEIFAGTGVANSLDNTICLDAEYRAPRGIFKASDGIMYITEAPATGATSCLRKINNELKSETLTGACFTDPYGLVERRDGFIYVADKTDAKIYKVDPAGTGSKTIFSTYIFSAPVDVKTDNAGNIYVADAGSNKIIQFDKTGAVLKVYGTGTAGFLDGNPTTAMFNQPHGLAVNGAGTYILVADKMNHCIRYIDPATNTIGTLAGSGGISGNTGGTYSQARFNEPTHVVMSNDRNKIYVADYANNTVRNFQNNQVYTVSKCITNPDLNPEAALNGPMQLFLDENAGLYVTDRNNNYLKHILPTYCDPVVTPGNNLTWYADDASVVDAFGKNYTKKITQLDGDRGIENYPINGVYPVDAPQDPTQFVPALVAGITTMDQLKQKFSDTYFNQHRVTPDIRAFELYRLNAGTNGALDENSMPQLASDNSLLWPNDIFTATDGFYYYLVKVKIARSSCEVQCSTAPTTNTCEDDCAQQAEMYNAELLDASKAVLNHTGTYTLGTKVLTLKKLIDKFYPLSEGAKDFFFSNDAPGKEIYNTYSKARALKDHFNIETCKLTYCNGNKPSACDVCNSSYSSCVYENITELAGGYAYLMSKWDPTQASCPCDGTTTCSTSSFPFILSDLRDANGNDNLTHKDGLGELLFNYICDLLGNTNGATTPTITFPSGFSYPLNINSFCDWSTKGFRLVNGDLGCNTCSSPGYTSALNTCGSVPMNNSFHQFPTMLFNVLQTANGRCSTEYTNCFKINENPDKTLCEEQYNNCITNAGTVQADIDACNSAYNCATNAADVMIKIREEKILEVLNELYSDPKVIADTLSKLMTLTLGMNYTTLENYLFDYLSEKKCILDCKAQESKDYSNWLNNYINTTINKIKQDWLTQCFGKLNETMNVSYWQSLYHYTLYNYDKSNHLTGTIPPDGIDYVSVEPNIDPKVPQHRMSTTYTSNSMGELQNNVTPDGGQTRYLYDNAGRVRFSQTSEQLARGTTLGKQVFSYTKYDIETNRLTQVGEYRSSGDLNGWFTCATCTSGVYLDTKVDDQTWPTNADNTFEETYFSYDVATLSWETGYTQTYLQGRVSKISNGVSETFFSYDAHGRAKSVIHHNVAFGNKYQAVDYTYTPVTGQVKEVAYQKKSPKEKFFHRYSYDSDNRLTKAEVSRNRTTWSPASDYSYYLHGPLKKLTLGNKIQSLDYTYNINGWLKAINHPIAANDPGGNNGTGQFAKDVFGEVLNYYSGDYTRSNTAALLATDAITPAAASNIGVKGLSLYNGNIASVITTTGFDPAVMSAKPLMAQGYRYDHLNRLVSVHNETYDPATFNGYSATPVAAADDEYANSYAYDPNGNITTLNRNKNKTGTLGVSMDAMTYNYELNANGKKINNKLLKVNDQFDDPDLADIKGLNAGTYNQADNTTHDYVYDAKGRLIKDRENGIASISWTSYDKVSSIVYTAPTSNNITEIKFRYDAQQRRIYKHLVKTDPLQDIVFLYTYDAAGNLMGVYENKYNASNANWTYTLMENIMYGSGRLGSYDSGTLLDYTGTAAGVGPTGTVDTNPTNARQIAASEPPLELWKITDASLAIDYGEQSISSTQLFPNISMGTYIPNFNEKTAVNAKIRFEISDHLGNVRAVVGGTKLTGNKANVSFLADYYPFGQVMPGRSYQLSTYRYGFNGKEKDDEIKGAGNYEDYGFRSYDNRLGRFISVDLLSDFYSYYSPYHFAGNSPIANIDLEGLEPYSVVRYTGKGTKYTLTQPALHLLHLVSGVSEGLLQSAVIDQGGTPYDPNEGGGGITMPGNINTSGVISLSDNFFERDKNKFNGNGYGDNIQVWLRMLAHEVGHLPQAYPFSLYSLGAGSYILMHAKAYTAGFVKTLLSDKALSEKNIHDASTLEEEAEKGRSELSGFRDYLRKKKVNLEGILDNSLTNDHQKKLQIDYYYSAYKNGYKGPLAREINAVVRDIQVGVQIMLMIGNLGGGGNSTEGSKCLCPDQRR